MCVTVVQWSRSCLHGFDSRRRCFLFLCIVFFFLFGFFFNTIFPFGLFFFILTADPAGHALGSIYILSLSPAFYQFGKGISKALDLHTGQAYDQVKTISCQGGPSSETAETAEFFSMLFDIMTNNTRYTTNCTNLHPTSTSDPLAKKVKLAFSACKESRVRQPGASGFCDRASEFCA